MSDLFHCSLEKFELPIFCCPDSVADYGYSRQSDDGSNSSVNYYIDHSNYMNI